MTARLSIRTDDDWGGVMLSLGQELLKKKLKFAPFYTLGTATPKCIRADISAQTQSYKSDG